MQQRAVQALDQTVGSGAWRLEALISRKAREATAVPLIEAPGAHHAWLALGDLAAVMSGSQCDLCRDPERARLVTINPRNFAAKSLPEPQLLMPLIADGTHNQSLWNAYNALQPERSHDGAPNPPSISFHGRTRLLENDRQSPDGTYFEPALVAAGGSLRSLVDARLNELSTLRPLIDDDRHRKLKRRVQETAKRTHGVDIVLVDREDIDAIAAVLTSRGGTPNDEEVSGLLSAGLAGLNVPGGGAPEVVVVSGAAQDRALVLQEITGRTGDGSDEPRLLLFALGLRLGVTLQRLLVDVHNAWREVGRTPKVKGMVLHAHPEDSRAWAAVRNAFWHDGQSDLLALWLTHLPHRSPLSEEHALLQEATKRPAPDDVKVLIAERLAELERTGPNGGTVRPFWSTDEQFLRRTSYYGDELNDRVTMAAVGSAMQRGRLVHRPHDSPFWYRFDLPKVFRSYFDGLIHVSALRWTLPREGWWGATDEEQELLIAELRYQAPTDWPLVLPELLLAGAQGKIPKGLRGRLLTEGEEALGSPTFPDNAKGWVRLGMHLLQDDSPTPEVR